MNKAISRLFGFAFLFFTCLLSAEKIGVLQDVLKVNNFTLDDTQLYVIENTSVYIYDLKDLKLKKKFGKEGEGPQEFKRQVQIIPLEKSLLVNSGGKISYFGKNGTFKREIKTGEGLGSALFFPIKDGYVGRGFIREDKNTYVIINFYDAELKRGQELYRVVSTNRPGGKIYLLSRNFIYRTYKDQVYIAGKEGFIIDVLDHKGKQLFSINREYKRRKVTDKDIKDMREALKLRYRDQYELLKDRITYPDYFPEISGMYIDQDLIYVLTWKRQGDKIECFIFDLKGNLKKQLFVSFIFEDAVLPYPVRIKGGKLYQLIENEDEQWELHITPIEF